MRRPKSTSPISTRRPRRRAGLCPGGRLVSQGGRPGRRDRPEQSRLALRQRPGRNARLRAGDDAVPQGGRPERRGADRQHRRSLRQRPGRAAGLRPGDDLVSQGRRPGQRGRPSRHRRSLRQRPGRAAGFRPSAGWYRKAADRGNASAESNVGYYYEKGRAVAQDYSQARLVPQGRRAGQRRRPEQPRLAL